jgi:hypothetical protein
LIHIANTGANNLLGWNPAAAPPAVVEASVSGPVAVSYGPFGLISNDASGEIKTSTGTVLATGLPQVNSLAQDSSGIYFTTTGAVKKLVPATGQIINLLSITSPALVMDSHGDLIIRDQNGIKKLNVGSPSESLGTTSLTVASAGGAQSVGVDFLAGNFAAPWSAFTAAPWLHLTNPSGKGPATMLFTVDANPAAAVRSANIVLDSGLVLTVTQAVRTTAGCTH